MAKVGSKRTPGRPAYCSEAQGGREGSEVMKAKGSLHRQDPMAIRRSPGDDRSKGPFRWSRSGELYLK